MNREAFKHLFETALEKAAQIAETEHHLTVPRDFVIEYPGWGSPPELIDVDMAVELMFTDENSLPRLVDVAITAVSPKRACAFVCVSGYPPVASFEKTYNTPPGSGPFKQIIAFKIAQLSDDALQVGAKGSAAWS